MLKDLSILMPENKDKLATTCTFHLANRISAAVPASESYNLEKEIMYYDMTPSSMLPAVATVQRILNCAVT